MIIKQVRLSQKAKEQLSRLKGKTGIKNWNILCRWALCYSLSEKSLPTDIPLVADSNLEMSWFTFGGEYYELYEALVKACLDAAKAQGFDAVTGSTRSHDALYLAAKGDLDKHYSAKGITGSDMETAAVLAVGRVRGVRACSILNVVVEWEADIREGVGDYKAGADAAAAGEKGTSAIYALQGYTGGEVIHTEPNTNLMEPRCVLPTLRAVLTPGTHELRCAVFTDAEDRLPDTIPEEVRKLAESL